MKGMLAVDCLGNRRTRRGGLALLWKEEGWDVSIMSFSVNHIDVMIEDGNGVSWHFTGVYGWPEEENKGKRSY